MKHLLKTKSLLSDEMKPKICQKCNKLDQPAKFWLSRETQIKSYVIGSSDQVN